MQHSHDFKRRGVNFSVDGRQLRAYRRSTDRKSWRDDLIMQRRCSSSATLDIATKAGKSKSNANTFLTPLKEKNEEVAHDLKEKKTTKKLTGAEERRLQLNKYKERKQLLKELEKREKQNKPVFKVCQVKHKFDPFAQIVPIKGKSMKAQPVAAENIRVTRSAARIAVAVEKLKQVVPKTQPILKPKAGKRANKNGVQKDETKPKRAKSVSFAPDGFKFTAPENLKYPSPRKAPKSSEKCAFEFAEKVAPKVESLDDAHVKKEEMQSIFPDIANENTDHVESDSNDSPEIDEEMQIDVSPNTANETEDKNELEIDSEPLLMESEPNNLSIIEENENELELEPITCDIPLAEVQEAVETVESNIKDGQNINSELESETRDVIPVENELLVAKMDEKLEDKSPEVQCEVRVEDEVLVAKMDTDLDCQISPFVTISRGSSSRKRRRRSQKPTYDRSLVKNYEQEFREEESREKVVENVTESKVISDCQETSAGENSPPKTKLLDRFKGLVLAHRTSFGLKINYWMTIKDEDDLPALAGNEIDVAIGMAELLMKQRFGQFEDLIADCEFNRGEKQTTCDDLLGFWEMIFHQVINIEAKFDKLEQMKKDNWKSQTPKPKRAKRRVKKTTPKAKPKAKPSQLRELIAAARKTKQTAPSKPDKVDSSDPSASEPRVTRSAAKRDGSISYLLKPTTPGTDDDDAFFSAENEENVIENIVQSVLASSSDATPLVAKSKTKLRRSVRFALSTKTNDADYTPLHTTPFSRKQKPSLTSSSSDDNRPSSSDSFITLPADCSHGSCTPAKALPSSSAKKRKKRKSGLLPVSKEEDLISFSPWCKS